jgi:TetR/AcrR family transcriptional regulator, copper-responsive repressor
MHNNQKRPRGRPRNFDVDNVLDRAMRLFWAQGLRGTSLDDLGAGMNMTRTSLQNAFGSKKQIYRRVFGRFVDGMKADAEILGDADLKTALKRFFDRAIDVYCSQSPALGCLVMCTAPLEAAAHPDIRRDLKKLIAHLDQLLEKRFSEAVKASQLPEDLDAGIAAMIVQSVLHSLALRSRAGESGASLRRMAYGAVDLICAHEM